MRTRNPLFAFTASILTLGLYTLYWHANTAETLRRLDKRIPGSWLQIVPGPNMYFYYTFIAAVDDLIGLKDFTKAHYAFHVVFPFMSAGFIQHWVNEFLKQPVSTRTGETTLDAVCDRVQTYREQGLEPERVKQRLEDDGIHHETIILATKLERIR